MIPQDGNFVLGINQLLFHKGHMIAPLARNAAARGEGTRRGAMASFDISDLSNIKRTFFRQDDVTNEIREAHGLVISSGDILCINAIQGVQFWDVSDPKDIKFLSDMRIPDMISGTYGKTGWWVMGQHPYYYLGSTQRGLHIINGSDPRNPVLVKRISGTDVGIPSIGSVHCIGNLMVLGSAGQSESTSGPFATLDISDPENPQLLDREVGSGNYSVGVYGNYITTQGTGGLKVWDMTNPLAVQQVYHNPNLDIALYSGFADGHFHIPNFWTYEKYDFPFPGQPLLVSSDVTVLRKTHEVTEKLGNLIVATGGGEGEGVKIIPHQAEPDTKSPEVNFVNPKNLATNQALSSRIGVIVTDTLDFETVNSSTFVVREVGGLPLAGDFSYSRNYLNFIPLAPLKANTTYEVILTTGGIKDIVGNGMVKFRSHFSTGAQVVVSEEAEVLITNPIEGGLVDSDFSLVFTLTNFDLGTGGRSMAWFLDNVLGGTVTSDVPIPINALSDGAHVLRLELMENGVATGVADSASFTVDPMAGNVAPRIVLDAPPTATSNALVVLDGSGSVDLDQGPGPLTYQWQFLGGPSTVVPSSTSGPVVTARLAGPGNYQFRLTLSDGLLSTNREFVVSVIAEPLDVLMITQTGGFLDADEQIRAHLVGRGMVVTGAEGSVALSEAENYDLVVISASIGSSDLNPDLLNAEIPMVVWEPYLFDDFGMTGNNLDSDYGYLTIANAEMAAVANPLTLGIPAGTVGIFTQAAQAAWGAPVAAAIVGATDGSGKALVFGYDQGSAMIGGNAPARRVGVPLGEFSFGELTPSGLAIFNNAIDWARGITPAGPEALQIVNNPVFEPRVASAATVTLAALITGGTGEIEYSWDVTGANGLTVQTPWSTSNLLNRTFPDVGNYVVVLRVRDDVGAKSKLLRLIIHHPLLSEKAVSSSGIALSGPGTGTVWNVNPDNDSVTVLNAATLGLIAEIPVAQDPRSLAMVGADEVWVACHDVPSVTILSRSTQTVIAQIALPRGSLPEGMVVDQDGTHAYVALRGSAGVARINVATRQVETILDVLPWPKGLALDQSGQNLFVTHFISPNDAGKVTRIDLATFTVGSVIGLAISTRPDTISAGRGLPNYLGHPGISPDGKSLLVPSKQDNILRGAARDGVPLNSENTVRAIVSRINLATVSEDHAGRWDLNDSDSPKAIAFSALGNVVFVSLQGTNTIMVLDAYNRNEISRFPVGAAPDALVLNHETGTLYVHRFLDRQVSAYDVSDASLLVDQDPPFLAERSVVTTEKLPAQVLIGKKIFYNAGDIRMSSNGYISCASCHLDGNSDGRVWDFTARGEGFRNTTDLRGRSGIGHGPIHWSANFDEIQDFENDIRLHFDGLGFMSQTNFQATSNPLGQPKVGLSVELDALAAYVTSLNTMPESPDRNPDGSLTADAVYGREIFARLNCATCHSDVSYTDSAPLVRHNVGTLKPTSGASFTSVDTPTLKGVWASPPYFHDGSALTLENVIDASGPLHGNMAALAPLEKQQLAAYLYQIETSDSNPGGTENSRNLSGYVTWRQENFSSTSSPIGAPGNSIAGDGVSNLLKYFAAEAPDHPGLGPVKGSSILSRVPQSGDPRYLQLTVRMRKDSQNLRYFVETASDFSDWENESVEPVLLDGSAPDYDLIGLRVPLLNRPAVFMRLGVVE